MAGVQQAIAKDDKVIKELSLGRGGYRRKGNCTKKLVECHEAPLSYCYLKLY
jgi:hypothetical protein